MKRYSSSLKNSKKLLNNKYVLYTTLALSILFWLWLLLANKIGLIIVYALIAYVIYCFNDNMIIVLGVSLIITYIATLGMKVKEGLTNQNNQNQNETTSNTKDDKKQSVVGVSDAEPDMAAPVGGKASSSSSSPITQSNVNSKQSPDIAANVSNTNETNSGTGTGTVTSKDGMGIMSNKKRNRIDYASTVEDAYDDLNNILGSNGMQRLTHDTHKLMEQQMKLADAMKNMTPLIESAKTLMSGFDFDGLNNIGNLAKQFMPSK